MSSKATLPLLNSRKIGLLALPNELLLVIVCDVLANFLHNMILRPNLKTAWNGLHTLRRVCRKLQILVEDTWTRAVGPFQGANVASWLDVMAYTRVLFHNQVQTIQLPEMEDVDRPLLLAYLLYGIGLFKESKQEQAHLSPPVPDQSTNPESGEFWYYKALRTVSRTRPLDMAQVIMPNLMTHILESKIAGLLQSVDYLVNVARAAPSVSLDTAELSLLEKCLSSLNILMKEVPEVMKQLAPVSLLALRGMVKRIEPVQDSKEDKETKLLRERVIRSMDTIWDHWNKTHVSATSHSRLMRKQAVWS